MRPAAEGNGFALQLDSKTWIIPSGKDKYVNHGCKPNVAFMKWTDFKKSLALSIVALEDIVPGSKILSIMVHTITYPQDSKHTSGMLPAVS